MKLFYILKKVVLVLFFDNLAEWSKACGSGPHLFGGAGSNPAVVTSFLLWGALLGPETLQGRPRETGRRTHFLRWLQRHAFFYHHLGAVAAGDAACLHATTAWAAA